MDLCRREAQAMTTRNRPLSYDDLRNIADYLQGSHANLHITLSELGYDPETYPRIRRWLQHDFGLIQHPVTHLWQYEE